MKNFLFVFMITLVSSALAQTQKPSFRKPPTEAFSVCASMNEGDQCTFSAPHGQIVGICRMPRQESRLVCVPKKEAHVKHGHPHDQSSGSNAKTRTNMRQHTVTQTDSQLALISASVKQNEINYVSIEEQDGWRYINANGIAEHAVGRFPNRGNPHAIKTQAYRYRLPMNPDVSDRISSANGYIFGVAVNGVVFDPGAAEFYQGRQNSIWQYDALSGAVELGFDENHAHVQPSGAYHYHGLPTLLLKALHHNPSDHSALVGWAADGFPIYALYGYQKQDDLQSNVIELTTSYRLKVGQRPVEHNQPGGTYDGTFVADYEYVVGLGDLDECNGRMVVTPEFPQGTYAYFLTRDFPVVPRCFKGVPETSFQKKFGRL